MLLKQIKDCFDNNIPEKLESFIKKVNATYDAFEKDIRFLDKTLEERADDLIIVEEKLRELKEVDVDR